MSDKQGTDYRDEIVTFFEETLLFGGELPVSDEASLRNSGLIDSMATMELVAFLETKFQITMEDEDLIPGNFDSIRQLCELVRRKKGG